MTRVTVSLPDDLVRRATEAGLLSDAGIQRLLEGAMRAAEHRNAAFDRFLAIAPALEAAGAPPITEEEIMAEIRAVRAERRAPRAAAPLPNADCS